MYNAMPIIIDRKTAAPGTPRTIFVPSAAVCITGGIQPKVLKRALGDQHLESGLAARVIFVEPQRRPKQWSDAEIESHYEDAIDYVVERLFDLQPAKSNSPVVIGLTPDAQKLFADHVNQNGEQAYKEKMTGALSSAWAKLEETPARIALVLHYLRSCDDDEFHSLAPIEAETMHRAIRFVEWAKNETRRIYDKLGSEKSNDTTEKMLMVIRRKGGKITPRELDQFCRWIPGVSAARTALDELVADGLGTWNEGRAEFILAP
jgi:hypothetical protein